MDEADVIINRDGDIFLCELLWRHLPVTMKFLVRVVPLPIELGGRCTEMDR